MNRVLDTFHVRREDMLDALSTPIAWKDTEGRYIGANQYFLKVVGLSATELIGKTDFDLVAYSDAEKIQENDNSILQTKKSKTFHEVVSDRYGNLKSFVSHKSPLFNDDGELIGIIFVASDITTLDSNKAKLKQALSASRSYIDGMEYFNLIATIFNEMANVLPANIYWKDINGVYIGCNDTLLDYIGISRTEGVAGKTIYDIVPSELAHKVHLTDELIMREGQGQALEEEGINSQGVSTTFFSYKTPVRNDAQEVIGMLGISFDITERRKMTDALMLAKQQAETASRAKSDFIMNMSHDIRTPFVGILGFAELLQGLEHEPKKLEMLGYIRESSERLLALLNEVIEVVNEDGMQDPEQGAINLRELLDDLQKMMNARTTLDQLTLDINVEESVPTLIYSDKQGINRVLLNLVGNAIKFTRVGSVTVTVSVD
ncbi:MAG: PAS domain-containing protein, partial [Pseudomonadota bacterium]|nr:PAS domain-containing protein [Pseudomonadota bacterium]